ncbi:RTC5 Restriction of telomere capping protein 5 [Candida maltosa Xu316]
MGQSTSTIEPAKTEITGEFTKQQLEQLFYVRCVSLLKPIELAFLKRDFHQDQNKEERTGVSGSTDIGHEESATSENYTLSSKELGQLLKLTTTESDDNDHLSESIDVLYSTMKNIGVFPFINDKPTNEDLRIEELIVSGRYKKIFNRDYDFLKLWFIGLSLTPGEENTNEKGDIKEQDHKYKVNLIIPVQETDKPEIVAKKIIWSDIDVVKSFNGVDVNSLKVNAKKLLSMITLFLINNSINLQNPESMLTIFTKEVERWKEFEVYSLYILKYANILLDVNNLQMEEISYEAFTNCFGKLLPNFIQVNLSRLISNTVLTSVAKTAPQAKPSPSDGTITRKKVSFPKFEESKIVTSPFISYVSAILYAINSPITITTSNIVKLYAGSESGFSIRSLETKIFKWQAPTLLIVSGKRVKTKTIQTNRRYQKFDEMYPRHFLASESYLKDWQHENDRITYAVLINQPWKNSNKNNFGDEKSVILSIQPRADYFKSVHNDVLKGQSIYFNNLGMGLGFGNNQPLNKNETKKYYPGDVSLTIEANLEFAIFRHLVNSSSNNDKFFQKSEQETVANEDYEDRFTITGLEVWGIGSTKELEEQRKQWEWEEQQAESRQSVNMRSLGEERAFLEMVGLVGNHGGAGGSV